MSSSRRLISQIIFTFFSISLSVSSQTFSHSGKIVDENHNPLEGVSIIAKPFDDHAVLKFGITNEQGQYVLILDSKLSYEIRVSLLGYIDEIYRIEPDLPLPPNPVVLKPDAFQLSEIKINYDFKPVIIKKDTVIYDVKHFSNGNERKLKDQLKKLPGVEVNKDGSVLVQGKKVTKFLVEGDSFFGGGTKLGIENIPADAVDKIEVIDHFTEVNFMKTVSDSDDLAMNVKLKPEKKEFIFGDVSGKAEIADDNGYYALHSGLFSYNKDIHFSFIGDLNSINKSAFTFSDYLRFEGGISNYLSSTDSPALLSFVDESGDAISSKSQFIATNFSFKNSEKISIYGYALYSSNFKQQFSETYSRYLLEDTITNETRNLQSYFKSRIGLTSVKFEYKIGANERLNFNTQLQLSSNNNANALFTTTNSSSNFFQTHRQNQNYRIRQYVEWLKKSSEQHSITLVVSYAHENDVPDARWIADENFLPYLLSLEEDDRLIVKQNKSAKTHRINSEFRHYWLINRKFHLYSKIGNNLNVSQFTSSEKQLFTDGSSSDLGFAGFGNNVRYFLNDLFAGSELKYTLGKWNIKPGLFAHVYKFTVDQPVNYLNTNKFAVLPQILTEYNFSLTHKLAGSYSVSNRYPELTQVLGRYYLQSYNAVAKGTNLQDEQVHLVNVRYSKVKMYRGLSVNGAFNFQKKIRPIQSKSIVEGIDQYNTAFQPNSPLTSWGLSGLGSYNFGKIRVKSNLSLMKMHYTNFINEAEIKSTRSSKSARFSLETTFLKNMIFELGYEKELTEIKGFKELKYYVDHINGSLELSLMDNLILTADYSYVENRGSDQSISYYHTTGISLQYQTTSSPLRFELSMENLLDTKYKIDYLVTDYIASEIRSYIFPRTIMLGLNYKL